MIKLRQQVRRVTSCYTQNGTVCCQMYRCLDSWEWNSGRSTNRTNTASYRRCLMNWSRKFRPSSWFATLIRGLARPSSSTLANLLSTFSTFSQLMKVIIRGIRRTMEKYILSLTAFFKQRIIPFMPGWPTQKIITRSSLIKKTKLRITSSIQLSTRTLTRSTSQGRCREHPRHSKQDSRWQTLWPQVSSRYARISKRQNQTPNLTRLCSST